VTNSQEAGTDQTQIGRVLHFVINTSGSIRCRPAFVVENFSHLNKKGPVNLDVFLDINDRPDDIEPLIMSIQNVYPNHIYRIPNTWHWPRECESLRGKP